MLLNKLASLYAMVALAPEGEGAGGEGAPAGGDGGGEPAGGQPAAGQGGAAQQSGGEQQITMDVVKQQLPQELREDPNIAKHQDLEGFARTFKHAQQMVGKDPSQIVEKPQDPTDADQRRQFLSHLGLPDTADGYQLQQPKDSEGNPIEAVPTDTDLAKGFIQKAHEVGILPDQAQELFDWFGQQVQETTTGQRQQTEQQAQQNIEQLKKEWGQAFDQNVRAANFAVEQLDEGQDGSLREKLDRAGLGSDPEGIKGLSRIGKMMSEDGSAATGAEKGSSGFGNAMAPDEARARGKEILRQSHQATSNTRQKELAQEAQKYFDIANQGAGS